MSSSLLSLLILTVSAANGQDQFLLSVGGSFYGGLDNTVEVISLHEETTVPDCMQNLQRFPYRFTWGAGAALMPGKDIFIKEIIEIRVNFTQGRGPWFAAAWFPARSATAPTSVTRTTLHRTLGSKQPSNKITLILSLLLIVTPNSRLPSGTGFLGSAYSPDWASLSPAAAITTPS